MKHLVAENFPCTHRVLEIGLTVGPIDFPATFRNELIASCAGRFLYGSKIYCTLRKAYDCQSGAHNTCTCACTCTCTCACTCACACTRQNQAHICADDSEERTKLHRRCQTKLRAAPRHNCRTGTAAVSKLHRRCQTKLRAAPRHNCRTGTAAVSKLRRRCQMTTRRAAPQLQNGHGCGLGTRRKPAACNQNRWASR